MSKIIVSFIGGAVFGVSAIGASLAAFALFATRASAPRMDALLKRRGWKVDREFDANNKKYTFRIYNAESAEPEAIEGEIVNNKQ